MEKINMTARTGWLTAVEAIAIMGVRPQTLYAYVTRDRIKARPDPSDPRRSQYRAADVKRLASRRGRRAETVAADTIAWGEPILPTAIATIAHGRLFYRSHDAIALAETATFEEVAALLWDAEDFLPAARVSRPSLAAGRGPRAGRASRPSPASSAGPRADIFAALAAAAGTDEPAWGRAATTLRREAAALVVEIVDVFTPAAAPNASMPIHRRLAAQWGCDQAGTDAIRRALVLLAEHELNASTFAARVAASTGASISASVLAGLCAFSGPLHGGAAAHAGALVEEAERTGAEAAIRSWLAQGRPIPGFGHPLYADGDARAIALLRAFRPAATMESLALAAEEITGERPNIDFAMTALVKTLGLPADAAFILFLTARSAGWLAHVIEQVASGHLIRPRARYVGPPIAPPGNAAS
jgi:citrate synthase